MSVFPDTKILEFEKKQFFFSDEVIIVTAIFNKLNINGIYACYSFKIVHFQPKRPFFLVTNLLIFKPEFTLFVYSHDKIRI